MKNTTTIKLNEGDIERLIDALLSQFPENLTEEQNDHCDRLLKRLYRAQDRV